MSIGTNAGQIAARVIGKHRNTGLARTRRGGHKLAEAIGRADHILCSNWRVGIGIDVLRDSIELACRIIGEARSHILRGAGKVARDASNLPTDFLD